MLKLEHIEKAYQQGKNTIPVLHDITFHVAHGEFVAIMGPSGSGKSTLMNLIGLLDTPTSGSYFFDGTEVSRCSENMLSQIRNEKIGFVFQNFNLLPRQSALENAALPLLYAGVKPKIRRERAREALEKVGLSDRVSFLPTQLSGGQKQRVAIARAMINHPKLLLADEPTGALDTASGEQVMELFHELHKTGVTIVMITHELEIAQHAERILTIRDGRLGEEQVG
ncbi:MAG: ABC transporter ATP-binding protein [Ruminococcus sp.]|nr:ABC transporter ATP-binding protein [Ruminococcus sp.]